MVFLVSAFLSKLFDVGDLPVPNGGFKGEGRWERLSSYWLIFFSKSRFFRVKGIYFAVRICDK